MKPKLIFVLAIAMTALQTCGCVRVEAPSQRGATLQAEGVDQVRGCHRYERLVR
ncbi:MAG: hypothetical protein R3C10_04320 [Pirellulales bacterium]